MPPLAYLSFQCGYTRITYRSVSFWEQQSEISTCWIQITSFIWVTSFIWNCLISHWKKKKRARGIIFNGSAYSPKQSEETIYFLHRKTFPSILNSLWCKNPNTVIRCILLLVYRWTRVFIREDVPRLSRGSSQRRQPNCAQFSSNPGELWVTRKNLWKRQTPLSQEMRFLKKAECAGKTLTPSKLQSDGPNQMEPNPPIFQLFPSRFSIIPDSVFQLSHWLLFPGGLCSFFAELAKCIHSCYHPFHSDIWYKIFPLPAPNSLHTRKHFADLSPSSRYSPEFTLLSCPFSPSIPAVTSPPTFHPCHFREMTWPNLP